MVVSQKAIKKAIILMVMMMKPNKTNKKQKKKGISNYLNKENLTKFYQ